MRSHLGRGQERLLRSLEITARWSIHAIEHILPSRLRLQKRRRSSLGSANAHNSAACLLPEIQLHIFHLLRTRARFGAADFFVRPEELWWEKQQNYPHVSRDLAPLRLVCRAWHDAATAVLYTEIELCTIQQFVDFADTLLALPRLARYVRRLTFPRDVQHIPEMQPAELCEFLPDSDMRWFEVKAAFNRLFVQCTTLQTIAIFGGQDVVNETTMLLRGAPSLAHFSSRGSVSAKKTADHIPTCDISLVAERLPSLTALTLRSWHLTSPDRSSRGMQSPMLPILHTLCLDNCLLEQKAFNDLLAQLRALRVFEWRHNAFSGLSQHEIALADLLPGHRGSLSSCTLRGPRPRSAIEVRVTLHAVGAFSALRTLSLSPIVLPDLAALPPRLVELDIAAFYGPPGLRQKEVLDAAWHLRRYAPSWPPSFRLVRMWDQEVTRGARLRVWRVVAFLLRGFVEQLGVELVVNLLFAAREETRIRDELRQRALATVG